MRQPIKHNGYAWDTFHRMCKEDKNNLRIRNRIRKLKRLELQDKGYNYGEAIWFSTKYVDERYGRHPFAKVAV